MGICYLMQSGGGASLNFKVVGGTSAPSSPNENTIWINTSTTITSYVFSATQPTGSDGMVWIQTGTSSSTEFNALKKNGIQVYPLSAMQYVSGAWVNKTAKSYQSGAWVDWWNGELYEKGNQYDLVTGGWESAKGSGSMSVTFGSENISFYADSYGTAYAYTKNKIDLSKYTQLIVEGELKNKPYTGLSILAHPSSIPAAYDTGWTVRSIVGSTGAFTKNVDISTLSGEYYVGFWSDGSNATVTKVQLK